MRSDGPRERLLHGRQALEEGRYLEALKTLEQAGETAEAHAELTRLWLLLNQPTRAQKHASQAQEVAGNHAPSRLWAAIARASERLAQSHTAVARAALDESLTSIDGAEPEARTRLLTLSAEADLGLGNAFRASRAADKAVQSAERPALLVAALRQAAAYAWTLKQRDRAEEQLLRARTLGERAGLLDESLLTEIALAELYAATTLARDAELASDARTRAVALVQRGAERLDVDAELRRAYLGHPLRSHLLGQGPAVEAAADAVVAPPSLPGASLAPPTATASASPIVARFAELASIVNSVLDLDQLLERVMDIAVDIIGADRGLLVLAEPGSEELEVKVARNLEGETIRHDQEFSRGVIREALKGREVITIDTSSEQGIKDYESVALYDIRSLLCLPLRLKDRIIGAVYLDNQRVIRSYPPDSLEFLRAFTHLAAIAIENAQHVAGLKQENVYLRKVVTDRFKFANIIGSSPAMAKVYALMEKAADASFPILLCGETGTGKEIIAKAIHFGSPRKDKPFVAQNCAAIPSELLESEMFGYKRGAFTGADSDKKGLFEVASGGTLFLDEIGEMDLSLQAKILRVLQDGLIRRVGETTEKRVEVRILSATNRDLLAGVERGSFRLDLYYRLNVFQIDLPPLRNRREDIPALAEHFLEKNNKAMKKAFKGFTRRALEKLQAYAWPGNVRELENAVARAAVFADAEFIDVADLPQFVADEPARAEREDLPAPASSRALELFTTITTTGGTFWDVVKTPFLRRDLSRDMVREVVRLGLEKSGWKYMRALALFNLSPGEYRRFMNFLAKFDCKVDRAGTGGK